MKIYIKSSSNLEDFVIENGILREYNGPGGDVVVPDGVEEIGESAFEYCDSIRKITIPNSVTIIEMYAFYDCEALTSIVIPDDVTEINDYAFENCISLKSVTIPDGVTTIRDYAFFNCKSLKNITIPESVTTIRTEAFYGCTSLKDVIIEGNPKIDPSAFTNCPNLSAKSKQSISQIIGEPVDNYEINHNYDMEIEN